MSDSLAIDGITVFNKTFNRGAVSSLEGYFNLFAKSTDTLVFSSVQIKPTEIVLKDGDLKSPLFLVYLHTEINELDELVISPRRFTGNLAKDSKNINTIDITSDFNLDKINKMQFEHDELSLPKNPAMLSDGTIPMGADFVEIFKLIAPDIFKKKEKDISNLEKRQKFKAFVLSSYTDFFYTDVLKLKLEDVGRFISFCEDDSRVKPIVKDKNEFLLTEFLIEKRKTFEE